VTHSSRVAAIKSGHLAKQLCRRRRSKRKRSNVALAVLASMLQIFESARLATYTVPFPNCDR
jgi:hypothetical protein